MPENATWLLIAIGVILYFVAKAAEDKAAQVFPPSP